MKQSKESNNYNTNVNNNDLLQEKTDLYFNIQDEHISHENTPQIMDINHFKADKGSSPSKLNQFTRQRGNAVKRSFNVLKLSDKKLKEDS